MDPAPRSIRGATRNRPRATCAYGAGSEWQERDYESCKLSEILPESHNKNDNDYDYNVDKVSSNDNIIINDNDSMMIIFIVIRIITIMITRATTIDSYEAIMPPLRSFMFSASTSAASMGLNFTFSTYFQCTFVLMASFSFIRQLLICDGKLR